MADWKKYERFVAELCSENYQSEKTTVIPNARIKGGLSQTFRQIDVLIDSRFGDDRNRRMIVDAKRYGRPINVRDVDTFHGMMIDCSASVGMLVCPEGYTDAAKKRAQDYINLKVVSLDEIEAADLSHWDDCISESCNSRKERGLVLWDSPMGIGGSYSLLSVCCTGKCDVCGDFHIWCWSCGSKFSLTDEDELKCSCDAPWFWLTAIEEDDDTDETPTSSVYLLLCTLKDVLIADRKPIK